MAVGHEPGRDAVGEASLLANFLHQPAAKSSAAENFVDHQRGVPVGVVSLQPGLAECHRALRYGAVLNEQRATVGRGRIGQNRVAFASRQIAKDAVDKRRQLRRSNVADGADNERIALELAGRERGQIGARNLRYAGRAAGCVPAVRVPFEGIAHPEATRQRPRIASLFLQGGERRGSHPLDVLLGEARLRQGHAQQIRALVLVDPEHSDRPVELVMSGRKAYLGSEFVQPAVKRGRVVFARPLVEHRGRERGGPVLARLIETRPAGKRELQRDDWDRMVLNEPDLDPAGACDAVDFHFRRAGAPAGGTAVPQSTSPARTRPLAGFFMTCAPGAGCRLPSCVRRIPRERLPGPEPASPRRYGPATPRHRRGSAR